MIVRPPKPQGNQRRRDAGDKGNCAIATDAKVPLYRTGFLVLQCLGDTENKSSVAIAFSLPLHRLFIDELLGQLKTRLLTAVEVDILVVVVGGALPRVALPIGVELG